MLDNKAFTKINKNLVGISEKTTSGITFLNKLEKQGKLRWPFINVNDSVTKTKFDNLYGAKHSLLDALNRSMNMVLSGKKILILGYGDVGKGCA